MLRVTYNAPEGDAKKINWFGLEFHDGKAVEVDEDSLSEVKHWPEFLYRAKQHPHFKVEEGGKPPEQVKIDPNTKDPGPPQRPLGGSKTV